MTAQVFLSSSGVMQWIRRLIGEVHRRSLWQVLGIYGVGSWAVYQVVLGLTEGIGLPDWLPGMVVVLILAGLPIVLATAFVQEGLPTRDELGRSAQRAEALDPTLFPQESAPPVEAPLDSGPPQASGGRLGRALTWRRSLAGGVVAFALLAAGTVGWVGLRALGIGPMGSLVAAGMLAPSDRILIADFESRGADTTLAAVVTEAFRIDFARSTLVRAADPTQMREVLRRMQRPDVTRLDGELAREIALRAGISTFLTGELAAAGRAYVLTARLVATESGEVLAAFRERARDEEDVISAIDRLSRAVRERTGESLKAIQCRGRTRGFTSPMRRSRWRSRTSRVPCVSSAASGTAAARTVKNPSWDRRSSGCSSPTPRSRRTNGTSPYHRWIASSRMPTTSASYSSGSALSTSSGTTP